MSRPLAVPCRQYGSPLGTRTVPRVVLDLVEPDPAVRAAAGSAARQLGAALEFDVAVLDTVADGLGRRCEEFFRATRALWQVLDAGDPPVGAVRVRVPLLDVRQKDSKTARVDLSGQLTALERLPVTRPLLDLLESAPDWDALGRLGALERDGDRSALTVSLRAPLWPLELGGPASPGEVDRELRLEGSHAAWRDRRARRLVRVRVDASEIWPDPSPYRSPVPA